jgi:hypothetical protein
VEIDPTLSDRIWRTRQVGIFFSNQGTFWIFLIFLAPLSLRDNEEFKFCYRDDTGFKPKPYSWIASEIPARDLIKKVKVGLRDKEAQYLKRVLMDVLWGWERYLAQVRADITGVFNCRI